MSRYIDANIAQHIADVELSKGDGGTVCWVLSHTPTVDAVPVVHGRWIKFNVSEWKNERECSNCYRIVKVETCMGKPMYKYCPYCGCRMEGEEE